MSEAQISFSSPIGILTLIATEKGISKLHFGKISLKKSKKALETKVDQSKIISHLIQAQRELTEYFEGKRKKFDIALDTQGTPFQKAVWNELKKIPYGKVLAYSAIAEKIGNPLASRAVGLANNKNPVGIIVPCHRVIGKSGKLVGYAGGISRKQKLLELESEL